LWVDGGALASRGGGGETFYILPKE